MNKTLFVAKGVLQLVFTVVLCVTLAGIGYIVFTAAFLLAPLHALR